MNRFYVEHSAITPEIRELERTGRIELVHFPYDPNSRSRRLKKRSKPSAAQIQDLNMPISELPGTWDDYKGSEHLAAIQNVIGPDNRRDALHIDSAYKSGCLAFVTCDSDILDHCEELTKLLGLRFFHPNRDAEAITHLGRQMSLPL